MASDVQKIIDWLYRRQFASRVYDFDNLLLDGAITLFRKSVLDAHAFVLEEARRKNEGGQSLW